MSISTDRSRVIYEGNGAARSFSFDFKVWDTEQIRVVEADEFGTETDVTGKAAVELSATGGTVTLPEAPAQGHRLAVYRSMPFLQEDRYLTGTRFDAHEIEDALDVACAERQELREKLGRTLVVPITSERTPDEVMTEILETAERAGDYAEKVESLYRDVVELRDTVETRVTETGNAQVEHVVREGDNQVARVAEEGERQRARAALEADRAENAADIAALTHYVSGAEDVLTLESDLEAGSVVDLPPGLKYLVGRHHLRLGYDGVIMSPSFFEEVGVPGEASTRVRVLFPLYAGQELDFWIIPLGEAGEILEEVRTEAAAQIELAREQAENASASAATAQSQAQEAVASAERAEQQAGVAAQQAEAAASSASSAETFAASAEGSAATAEASAATASEKANEASASAVAAGDSASNASTYADTAKAKAGEAVESAEAASASAKTAQSSAATAQSQAQEAATSAVAAANSAQSAQAAMSKVYRFCGSVTTFDALPGTDLQEGDVYDVQDTDINYAWTGTKWDALGGKVSVVTDPQPTAGSANPVASGSVYTALQEVQKKAEVIDSCLVTSINAVPSTLREGGIIFLKTTV